MIIMLNEVAAHDNRIEEQERIEALKRYQILDTPPDGAFDRITTLAATLFRVPIALITLVDTDRIWFKSRYGLDVAQIDRSPGLCASAILSDSTYVVEDARRDPRTLSNPLVAGSFGLQFYAASPLVTHDHHSLGNLCIIDKEPRTFSREEQKILKQLGQIVMDEMDLRLALRNTVQDIRNITSEISMHLTDAVNRISTTGKKEDVLSYLDSSRLFIQNIENKLNSLN